jgi:hypothetical protein
VFRREVKPGEGRHAVRNQDVEARGSDRAPGRDRLTLVETAPAETTIEEYRFRVEAAPVLPPARRQERTGRRRTLSNGPIVSLSGSRERTIDPDVERVLREVVAKRGEVEAVRREIQSRESEQQNIFNDQGRLRENLGKLGDSSEEKGLRRRYVRSSKAGEPPSDSGRACEAEAEWRRLRRSWMLW